MALNITAINNHRITRLPRIAIIDTETRFYTAEVHAYQLKQYSPYLPYKSVKDPVKLVCVAWKWLGENTVHSTSVLKDPVRFANDPS